MGTQTKKLSELAKTIRSKNAGVDKITFDIIFPDRTSFELVRKSGVVTRDAMAKHFRISAERITDFVYFDPALAIKFTILRSRPSGSPGDSDIFGSQQYGSLLELELPAVEEAEGGKA